MGQTGGKRIRHRAVFGGVAIGLVVGACTVGVTPGQLQTPGDIDGLPITHFESGFKEDAPEPDVDVRNVSNNEEDRIATAAIADLVDYWGDELPDQFQQDLQPVDDYLSYDSRTDDEIPVCGTTTQEMAMNAFYCPPEDVIGWDRGQLFPLLREQFGPMGVVTVLGHEYGHAIQGQLGSRAGITEDTATIVQEQQADCFAGSYFRWMAEENSDYFELSTSEGLNHAMASLFFSRDTTGRSAADPDAHGMAFDRTYAFQLGFEKGPEECAAIDEAEVESRITQQPFNSADENAGDAPINDTTIGLLKESLDEAFAGTGAQPPTIVNGGGSCPDGPDTWPASYCPNTNTVNIDQQALAVIGQPIDEEAGMGGDGSGGLGDFAAFAEIVSRYVQGIQHDIGIPVDNDNAGLRTACLVGAWAEVTTADGGPLVLSPGDLDEAIAELLQPRSLIGADLNGHRVPNGFSRIEALRHGYFEGAQACSQSYP